MAPLFSKKKLSINYFHKTNSKMKYQTFHGAVLRYKQHFRPPDKNIVKRLHFDFVALKDIFYSPRGKYSIQLLI